MHSATELRKTALDYSANGPRRSDRHTAIIEAARDLFTTQGYETTTIADVAKRAGVAVGTVYLYFKNKNELLYGVKGDWEREFVEFMSTPDLQAIPPHKRLRPLVEACFELCARYMEMVQLMGMSPQMVGQAEYRGSGLIHQELEHFFGEGIAAGSFRPIDAAVVGSVAFGMVYSAIERCFDVEGGANQELYINTIVDAFERWLVEPEQLSRPDAAL